MELDLLRGDGGLFFNRKIRRISPDKILLEEIKKWIAKTYRYYSTQYRVISVENTEDKITIMWESALGNGSDRNGEVEVILENDKEMIAVLY